MAAREAVAAGAARLIAVGGDGTFGEMLEGVMASPEHLRRGKLGELAAKKYLQKQGMKFLAANFRSERGEIDLILKIDCEGSEYDIVFNCSAVHILL